MAKSYKLDFLKKIFYPLIDFFESNGIAGTFPIMIIGITIAIFLFFKRRKNKQRYDYNDFFLIVIITGLVVVFILDQLNINQ